MIPVDAAVKAPTGYAEFPREMLRPPRSLAKKMFVDIQRWTVMKKGGHFAAMETNIRPSLTISRHSFVP
jgi:hypothetical protein